MDEVRRPTQKHDDSSLVASNHIHCVARAKVPTLWGDFEARLYSSAGDNDPAHLALLHGQYEQDNCLVRVHSECLTGDALGSLKCDCGEQLRRAYREIVSASGGVIIYMRGHEGRGIGLIGKLKAYEVQEEGRDTVDANLDLGYPVDARDYSAAAVILADLGIVGVRLLTNNNDKVEALQQAGVRVIKQLPLPIAPNCFNIDYLRTKRDRLGHSLDWLEDDQTMSHRADAYGGQEEVARLQAENERLRALLSRQEKVV
jgi:3,4-dihydroxy 2-butanone 4-phosphate synthase / GTP cyclohydrolase II